MIEISYLAGNSLVTGRRLVTYLETYPGPGHHIADEPISGQGMYCLSNLLTTTNLSNTKFSFNVILLIVFQNLKI